MAFSQLFGETLASKSGAVSTEDALTGKHVFVYASGHWCPPCRGFTPKLAEFYTKHKVDRNFEVVFVSSDRSEDEFNEYFKEMPWYALPYADRMTKEKLSKMFKVQGIPHLALLDPSGTLITANGRQKVMENFETCAGFPWKPPTFIEALGDSFVKQDGSKVGVDAIAGKTLGLYFSAEWCPPCRGFTPKLKEFYDEYKKRDPNFELVFVSSDKDSEAMMDYFKNHHGDYLALPFEKRKEKGDLSDMFEVSGIPSLVVLGKDHSVLNLNARGKVAAGVDAVLKEGWEPPAVGDLAEGPEAAGSDINETPTIVMFCEQCDEAAKQAAKDAVVPLAQRYIQKAKASGDPVEYIFLMGTSAEDCEQLKALMSKTRVIRCPRPWPATSHSPSLSTSLTTEVSMLRPLETSRQGASLSSSSPRKRAR